MIGRLIARYRAWRDHRAARAELYDAMCKWASARLEHRRSAGHGKQMLGAYSRMCRARRTMRTGRA